MAAEFLMHGASVFITGRSEEAVKAAIADLSAHGNGYEIGGGSGDVASAQDQARLAAEALAFLGGIDHWINNAGVAQARGKMVDLEPEEMERVVSIDFLGPLYGARAARQALEASGGFLWFMEGHGSDGRVIDGLSLYGASKRGVSYLWKAMAKEAEGSPMKVGALSPGIMATDFILQGRENEDREAWERMAKTFNILGDKPETVAAWLVPRILDARKTGVRFAWLGTGKILFRFLTAGIRRRKLF
jgi:NAD(P)-dependent dehydrogenase (short-subunit alcohol dehydrogenase family)